MTDIMTNNYNGNVSKVIKYQHCSFCCRIETVTGEHSYQPAAAGGGVGHAIYDPPPSLYGGAVFR